MVCSKRMGWVLAMMLPAGAAWAVPGEDGAQTFTGSNVVVNNYSTLTAQSGSTFTVANAANLALPPAACPNSTGGCLEANRSLRAGDLLLVYQPQGASISTTDNLGYGSISNYNNAGRYEFVHVASVSGNTITIADSDGAGTVCSGGLRFTYAAGAMVVRVPQYSSLTVNSGASIVPGIWDGSTGGVVAVHVGGSGTGNIAFNGTGSINADARGFRGGVKLDRTVVFGITNYVCANPNGAQKGEGIAANIYSSTNNLCRGAPANGGGGGNNHNAGGGGGANGGFAAADPVNGGWLRGIGVYPASGGSGPFSFLPAWAMDVEVDPDLSGPNPPQTSTGGGRGGYTYADATFDPLTTGPGNSSWNGDLRRVVGGLGGRPLNGTPLISDAYRRLYFGGGGGAGEMNNSQGGNGGAGGGLVFLIAQSVSGNGRISANGAAGQNTSGGGNNDAPGGGGGGGSVVLSLRNGAVVPAGVSVQANGGAGGNQLAIGSESEGPGGGGGGGVILYPGGGVIGLNGGAHGTSDSSGLRASSDASGVRRFPANGATSGAGGSQESPPPRHGPNSPFSCLEGPGNTTPVSTAWFSSSSQGGRLEVRFAAAAEIAHAAYRLEAQTPDGARVQLGALIPADTAPADQVRSHVVQVEMPADGSVLYLADIDLQGRATERGPFQIGQSHGSPPSEAAYDFAPSRALLLQSQQRLRAAGSQLARLGVSERGMYRISHEQLQAAGFDFTGVPVQELAVQAPQGAVPRRIRGAAAGVFGPGAVIEFFGDAQPSLWSRERYYLLSVDASAVLDMSLTERAVQPGEVSTYQVELRHAPNTAYNHASPSGDPWYAERLLASGQPVSRSFQLQGPLPSEGTGELELVLWGGIDWPGETSDHSVEVLFNGAAVASRRFDGLAAQRLSIPVSLSGNSFEVQLRLPFDTGYEMDIVHLESVALRYRAVAQASGGRFFGADPQGSAWDTIFAEGGGDPASAPIAGVVTVAGVAEGERRAYRIGGGTAAEFAVNSSGPVALYSEDFSDPAELWVSRAQDLLVPSVSAVAPAVTAEGAVDWLVISHEAFTPALGELVALRQQQGLRTRVVDVSGIYSRYSAGNPDPQAIRHYIAAARAQMGVRYVLLVGADTLDAPGYLNSGSVSFIPTPYAATSTFVRYAPADPLLADTDFDGVPDVALGRLPVRTLAEAQEAVRKIVAYESQPVSARATLSAGPQDPLIQSGFAAASTQFGSLLPGSWVTDQLHQDQLGLDQARLALVDAFNSGRSLISYMGHSGPTRWTFDPLLDISQVLGQSSASNRPNLLPSDNQPVVLQFACWTTYFVSSSQNSMAQALLLTPGRGASAVVGATVLLDQRNHERMAQVLAPRLLAGVRIGDALLAAKRELGGDVGDPAGPELLLGQILLGDPAQPLR